LPALSGIRKLSPAARRKRAICRTGKRKERGGPSEARGGIVRVSKEERGMGKRRREMDELKGPVNIGWPRGRSKKLTYRREGG
jgi:hypothetical protein